MRRCAVGSGGVASEVFLRRHTGADRHRRRTGTDPVRDDRPTGHTGDRDPDRLRHPDGSLCSRHRPPRQRRDRPLQSGPDLPDLRGRVRAGPPEDPREATPPRHGGVGAVAGDRAGCRLRPGVVGPGPRHRRGRTGPHDHGPRHVGPDAPRRQGDGYPVRAKLEAIRNGSPWRCGQPPGCRSSW